jgi:hypothetical protein
VIVSFAVAAHLNLGIVLEAVNKFQEAEKVCD